MGSHFVIEGLSELQAEMRAIDRTLPRELTKATKQGAVIVANRTKSYAPERTGRMKSTIRPTSGPKFFGVRATHPGAGVQEFATDYIRRERGAGGGVSRGLKGYHKATGNAGSGTEEVHMVNVNGPPPRFLNKALNELGDVVAEGYVWDNICGVLQAHGWWA